MVSVSAAPFTPGNFVVARVGSGTGSLINTGNPVFLDEFTPAGTLVQSVALPTAVNGLNKPLILSGTATSEGMITRSADGQYLVLPGYGTTPGGGTSLAATTAAAVNRVVSRTAADATIDTTTALTDYASADNPRSGASSDGTKFWLVSGTGGVRYASALSATTSIGITSSGSTNNRVVQIFNGQLYASNSSGTNGRVGAVGSGLPTTAGQAIVGLPGIPTSGSHYNFFFADLDAGVAGNDTLYLAEDTAGGGQIQKFSLVAGTWTAKGTIAAAAVRGLTGSVSGSTVTLFGTTGGSGSTGGGSLYKLTDASGYNATITGTLTTIATAAANTAFRGVAPAPVAIGGTTAPAITTQPTPQTVTVGGTATFTAAASGNPVPTLQWRKGGVPLSNGVNVSGSTTGTLTLSNVPLGDNGTSYDVVASNGVLPNATSISVTLTVNSGSNTPPTVVAAASTTARLSAPAAGPAFVSGVIGDPTDPAATSGIDFTIGDVETAASALTLSATSSNAAVVPNTVSALAVSGTGATRNLKISPAGVGYATITVTVSDGASGTANYVINYAASAAAAQPATTRFFTGATDASTVQVVDASYMFVADDEGQALRLYDRNNSGLPAASFDFTSLMGFPNPDQEVDIEASVRVGSRLYWFGSGSNNSSFNIRPNRDTIFATDISGSGAAATLSFIGLHSGLKADLVAWDQANGHGKGANFYGLAASTASGVDSKTPAGFNIEGAEMAPDGTTAYLGFRAPQVPPGTRAKTLIVPVTNFTLLSGLGGAATTALFGAPIELDLGGRGIREIRKNAANQYVIIAGPAGEATGVAPADFRLYTWDGNAASPAQLRAADLTGLGAPGSFEGIVELPASLTDSSVITLVLDSGSVVNYGDGVEGKDLPQGNWKKSRSVNVTLGAVVSGGPIVSTAYWDFTVATPTGLVPGNVSGGAVTQGNNNGTTPLLTTTSGSTGAYVGASGGNNAGAAARTGPFDPAISAYFEFTLTPAAGLQLSASAIKFGSRGTGTGPQAFAVYTSVDGFTTPVATGTLPATSAWGLQSPAFTTVTGPTGLPITFRIYGFNGAGSPGANTANWRIDDLSLTISTVAGAPSAPVIIATTPANGATNVALAAPVTVTFNQAVNVTGSWFSLTGSTSGVHVANVTGGPGSFTLTPTTSYAVGETVTLTVFAAQVTDQATGALHPSADFTATFTILSGTPLAIHTVQGSGLTSPFATQFVTVQGVVVASFQGAGKIGGYYIEAPDVDQDADPATSEGIYVFDNANSVTVGDFVTLTGTVVEFGTAPNSETEISPVSSFTKSSTGNPLPGSATVNLPFPSAGYAERYEGMRVTLAQTLTVTDNFDYGHFGELILSNGRLSTPTNVVAPGAPAQAQEAANLLNQLILDDGSSTTYPDPTPFLNSADPALATRRTGSTTTGLVGMFANKFGAYVIEPTASPVFVDANPRVNSPASSGTLRVAIGNIENFMNGDGAGGGFPTSRGATTFAEYQRQLPKVTAALLNLAPDIMGLTEVENDRMSNGSPDSYGPTSAIAQLVVSLNASAPAGTTYAFVNAAAVDITTDVIHVAFIYRTETVETIGLPAMLSDPAFNNVARNPLAQTFRQKSNGEKLTVCINHFRAKASAAAGAGNADSGDGQGTNNALRVQEADATTAWLATHPTGDSDPDILIIGDLNAYAKEDPINHILNAGYISLTERFEGVGGYSYAFGGEFGHLDHALATPALNAQVVSAATWHVNSDEPVYYDYNVENKAADQLPINAGTPFRYSDHDPVVIGLNLAPAGPPTQTYAAWAAEHGLTPGQDAPTADPDADGISNLLEYFLGLQPTISDPAGLPVGQLDGGEFAFRFNRSKTVTGVTYRVLVSTDLTTWTPSPIAPILESETSTLATYVVKFPLAPAKFFARLEVTLASTDLVRIPTGGMNFVLAVLSPPPRRP